MVNGALCVIMDGIIMKPMWYVDSWDLDIIQEQPIDQLTLVKDQDQYYYMMYHAFIIVIQH